MKIDILLEAANLFYRWERENNNDTRVPDHDFLEQYREFCQKNGLNETEVELFAKVNYMFGAYIEQQLSKAKLEAMTSALNDIAHKLDKEEHPDATKIYELSAKLVA